MKRALLLLVVMTLALGGVASAVGNALPMNSGQADAASIRFFGEAARLLTGSDDEDISYISTITLSQDSDIMVVNGEELTVTPPCMADRRELLPIADIAEALGAVVEIDDAADEIIIVDDGEVTVLDSPPDAGNSRLYDIQQVADVLTLDYLVDGDDIVLTRPFQSKMLLVWMRPGKTLSDMYGAAGSVADGKGHYVLKYDSISQAKNAHDAIMALPDCQSIAPNLLCFPFDTHTSTENARLAQEHLGWGADRIHVDLMMEHLEANGKTNNEIVVAVVDTGVESTHPHLASKLKPGRNFSVNPRTDNTTDRIGHGTHVAGIVVDCSPGNVKILPVKVINDAGASFITDVAEGVQWAVDSGAKIINMSIGAIYYGANPDWDLDMRVVCDYAIERGAVIVAAAGNPRTTEDIMDTKYVSPARLSTVITVTATDENDQKESSAYSGDAIDVSAPGADILSSWLAGRYFKDSGTSMAAPHVSAAVAMLSLDNPSHGFEGLKSVLQSMCVDLGEPGKDIEYGWGIIDFEKYGVFNGGVRITGQIQSYNPRKVTSITLYEAGKNTVCASATIEAEATGSGQVTQEFSLMGVSEGVYDLVVSKQTHLNYTITGVIVGGDDLDLTENADPNISLITLLCGDINEDGYINSSDLSIVILPANYNKQTTENGVDPLADLTGSGWVNSSCLSVVILPANYNKTHVVYAYKE